MRSSAKSFNVEYTRLAMKSIADSEKRLANMEQKPTDLYALLATLREMTDIMEAVQTKHNDSTKVVRLTA